MPLPAMSAPPSACQLLMTADPPAIVLPGGAVLKNPTASGGGDPFEALQALLGTANSAMAPLQPIFDIIGAVMAIKDVLEGLPKMFTGEPDAFVNALAALPEKLAKLVALIPQMSVPVTVQSFVKTVAIAVRGFATKLGALVAHAQRLDAATARANTLPEPMKSRLLDAVGCAQQNLSVQQANDAKGMEAINQLIALVNTLIKLVPGLPCIPTLGAAAGLTQEAIDALLVIADILDTLAGLIPGGSFEIPALPPAGETPPDC